MSPPNLATTAKKITDFSKFYYIKITVIANES